VLLLAPARERALAPALGTRFPAPVHATPRPRPVELVTANPRSSMPAPASRELAPAVPRARSIVPAARATVRAGLDPGYKRTASGGSGTRWWPAPVRTGAPPRARPTLPRVCMQEKEQKGS
jgi:hypothetical protein